MWFNKRRKWYDHLHLCWKSMGQNSWSILHKKHSKVENKQDRKYRNRSKYTMPIVYSKGSIWNQKNNKWWIHSGSGRSLQLFVKFYIYALCTSLCIWYIHNKIIYKWWKSYFSKLRCLRGFPGGSESRESGGDLGLIPGLGSPLEREMATHSSTLAWKIP